MNRSADDLAAGRRRAVLIAGGEALHTLRLASKRRVELPGPRAAAARRRSATIARDRIPTNGATGSRCRRRFTRFSRSRCGRTRIASPPPTGRVSPALAASFAAVGGDPSAGLVSRRQVGRGDRHAEPCQSHDRVPVSEVHDLDPGGRPGGRGDHDDRRRGPYARDSAVTVGVRAWRRRGERHLVRQGSGRLPLVPGNGGGLPAGDRASASRVAAISISSISTVAFRWRRRSRRALLGVPSDGSRPLTVTGGLPYFGGAGNNYALHAIATMVQRLRAYAGRPWVWCRRWAGTSPSTRSGSMARPLRIARGSRDGVAERQRAIDAAAPSFLRRRV